MVISLCLIACPNFFFLVLGESLFFVEALGKLFGPVFFRSIGGLVVKNATYFFLRLVERLSRLNVSCTRSNLIFLSSALSVPKLDR